MLDIDIDIDSRLDALNKCKDNVMTMCTRYHFPRSQIEREKKRSESRDRVRLRTEAA